MGTDHDKSRATYGVDAPRLVTSFSVVGVIAAGVAVWMLVSPYLPLQSAVPAGFALVVAAYALGMATYMLYGSLVVKVRAREALLDRVAWRGDESVLDVGCGRGLLLTAAARRVPAGRAVGIDVWAARDQSGNTPDAALANCRAEGVAERVELHTGDARRLPFADAMFDVVMSHWVVHNIEPAEDRLRALSEMARVLRPEGTLLVADIANHAEHVSSLAMLGLVDMTHHVNPRRDRIRRSVTFGSFRPGVVIARKPVRPVASFAAA